jgi:hypothetical protein
LDYERGRDLGRQVEELKAKVADERERLNTVKKVQI